MLHFTKTLGDKMATQPELCPTKSEIKILLALQINFKSISCFKACSVPVLLSSRLFCDGTDKGSSCPSLLLHFTPQSSVLVVLSEELGSYLKHFF